MIDRWRDNPVVFVLKGNNQRASSTGFQPTLRRRHTCMYVSAVRYLDELYCSSSIYMYVCVCVFFSPPLFPALAALPSGRFGLGRNEANRVQYGLPTVWNWNWASTGS